MLDQGLFYCVFFSQVLFISFVLPRRLLSRLRRVADEHPPSLYPRLYPVSIERMKRVLRIYSLLNHLVLLTGLGLLVVSILPPEGKVLGWDSGSLLTLYLALQFSPLAVVWSSVLVYSSLMKKKAGRRTRKAQLHRRRFMDFLSPPMIGAAIFVYVAFVILIIYFRQFDFPWFGGYLNILGVTATNLFFLGIVLHIIYGKRKDPYQAYEDRLRGIAFNVKVIVFSSILMTVSIAVDVILRALELENLIAVSTSLYFQIVAAICYRSFQIDDINFEVYREEPLIT